MANGGRTLNPLNCPPIQAERPDIFDASESAKPPPSFNSILFIMTVFEI